MDPLRILVALDGSRESETTLSAILPLVRVRPTEVTLYKAVETREEAAEARAYLMTARQALRAHDVAAEVLVSIGTPEEEIPLIMSLGRHELAAMATHGRTGLRRVLMGSVTEAVLRRATVPLLICRPGTVVGDWSRIVVALDGSEQAEEILSDAAVIAKLMKATLRIVRVTEPVLVMARSSTRESHLEVEEARPYLAGVCERLAEEGIRVFPAALNGEPASTLLQYVQDIAAGLICMTTHGRTGLSRAFLGSFAEAVIRSSPAPVLVRRMKGGSP